MGPRDSRSAMVLGPRMVERCAMISVDGWEEDCWVSQGVDKCFTRRR